MTTQNTKRFMMPLFAFVFFIMLASGARAADYLWEPKLLWESKESYEQSIGGLQFINDDSQVLYCADGKLYVRDAQTGEILKQSMDEHRFTGIMNLSSNKKYIYALIKNSNNSNSILSFDFESMKCIDSAAVPSFAGTIDNGETFLTIGLPAGISGLKVVYNVSDKKNVFLLKTERNNPDPQGFPSIYGYCLASIDANIKFSQAKYEDWKIEYYFDNPTIQHREPTVTKDNKYFIFLDEEGLKAIELETMKEYFKFPGYYFVAANPSLENILIVNHNEAIVYNINENRNIYSFDYRLMNTLEYTTASISNLLLDSSKILFSKPGTPYYDLTDSKSKFLYNKDKYYFPYNYNLNKNTKMFIGDVYHQNSGNHVTLYQLEEATTGSVNTDTDDFDTIISTGGKLIIPFNRIVPNEILIYNSDGKLINQFSTFDTDQENVYLNISFLNQGIYFATVITSSGSRVNYKFLKGE